MKEKNSLIVLITGINKLFKRNLFEILFEATPGINDGGIMYKVQLIANEDDKVLIQMQTELKYEEVEEGIGEVHALFYEEVLRHVAMSKPFTKNPLRNIESEFGLDKFLNNYSKN